MQLEVVLTANHGGKFFFRVCPRSNNLDEACFGDNFLTRLVWLNSVLQLADIDADPVLISSTAIEWVIGQPDATSVC